MLSNMQVFNEYVMPAVAQMYPQQIEKFNAASAGAIQLQAANFDGDFAERSFYAALHQAQRRVDRYAANSDASGTNLSQLKDADVKVAGGFGPIVFEPSQMSWLNKPTQEAITTITVQLIEALMADQLNTAILALSGAIGNNASAVLDVAGTSRVGQSSINSGLAKFGDSSRNIVALIMTGIQYHNLVGDAIANQNNLFEIGGIAVRDGSTFGQGRSVIVTDAPALRDENAGSPIQKVLGLASGAAVIKDGGDIITNIDTTNGKQRIETSMQADYTFGLGLLGYSWDTANGGKSPSDAAIGTGANWDKTANSDKFTAGVLIQGNEA